jgi:hypothetical protein
LPDASVTLGTDATKLPLAGGTLTGDLNFGDNVDANFGAGADLKIHHDGSHSHIHDNGTGNLKVRADNLQLMNAAASASFIEGVTSSGVVTLYHARNAPKLATSATGIAVTGTLVESVPTNAITSIVTPGNLGNINFGTSWANINTTYYKWVLPSAGTYLVGAILRARQWTTNGFLKVRLYNNTGSAAISLSDRMVLESADDELLLNAIGSPIWKYTASGAQTLYLQGLSSVAGNSGIQEDSNGMNECWHVKLF